MPTARTGAYLQRAIDLAARLKCTLVALCSKHASVEDAQRRARTAGIELVAIDIARLPPGLLPTFLTTDLLAGGVFERRQDTSVKRNLGLLFARFAGWQRIVFLDDDIEVPEPGDLRDAASLLDTCAAVGLHVGGFPDNSVVCHAYREAGGPQDTFVGGGALAVGWASMMSFFPRIYNEDWFFLLDDVRLKPIALTGTVKQAEYDPFANDWRARSEEFGDTLAEGVFSLLDLGRRVQDADLEYWRVFLSKRRRFLTEVLRMIPKADKDSLEKACMITAIKAARGRSKLISPQLCVDYLRAWRADRTRWRRHVDGLCPPDTESVRLPTEKVFSELGLVMSGKYVATGGQEAARERATIVGANRLVS